jgi:hypothetical protein
MSTLSITLNGKLVQENGQVPLQQRMQMKTLLKRIELRCRLASARSAASVDPPAGDSESVFIGGSNVCQTHKDIQPTNRPAILLVHREEYHAKVN